MARRRQFVGAALFTALLVLLLFGWGRIPLALDEQQAQALLRPWLTNDYRQSGEDPALRAPAIQNAANSPVVTQNEAALIAFTRFELRRPWSKPSDAAHAALACVEIVYNGGAPPDGENVRFFLLAQSKDGAWQVRREISESAYRWRLGA